MLDSELVVFSNADLGEESLVAESAIGAVAAGAGVRQHLTDLIDPTLLSPRVCDDNIEI
ncbi:hypothetical protein [Microbacterium halotolerans]|uniref:hypothetical protein n=1 Tax=Microbacterium halotolerans TaxID=246613 RepID=UPI0013C360E2|nr:hypothetical protein [Microbacterium halotolerans]